MTVVDQIRNILRSREYDGDPEEDLRSYEAPNFETSAPKEAVERVRALKERIVALTKGSDHSYERTVRNVIKVEQNMENYEGEEVGGTTPEMEAERKEFLDKFLTNLNPAARKVIALRLEGKTLEQVGDAIGFTRERARQIEEETLSFFQKTRMFKDATRND